jgi:glucose/arabinose dehydrogenase
VLPPGGAAIVPATRPRHRLAGAIAGSIRWVSAKFGPANRVGRPLRLGLALALAACGQPSVTPGPTPSGTSATSAPATAAPPPAPSSGLAEVSLALDVVATGLASPVDVAAAGDGSGRTFVVEQAGRIRIVTGSGLVDRPFLDISARIKSGGEQGLLGLAFHPDFPADPRFFVDYTDRSGDTVVSEFRVDPGNPDVTDPGSERVLLHIHQPFANHNGGGVVFGPDGMLYVATGDGGAGGDPLGNGQRLDTLLAKILRIDVAEPLAGTGEPYRIPDDNPFAGGAGGLPEIWLTGLRNPWRFRFDPQTGDLWIGDVGQGAWEEIDVARSGSKGLDFGWNRMEGFHCYAPSQGCDQAGLTLPVAEYGHDLGCAVIGGVVVRGSGQSSLDGRYVFSDSCSGNLWWLDPAGDAAREPTLAGHWSGSISSIAQDEDGRVLATDLGNGQLLVMSAVAD